MNNALSKRRIETALSVIRRSQHERASLSQAPEIFDLYCVCAIYDRPFTLRFVRQASGLLRFKESLKGVTPAQPDNERAGGTGYRLDLKFFEKGSTPCAWCRNGSFHHCIGYCDALVCGGRMKTGTFHCRQSCGAAWIGIPLHEVDGISSHQPLTEAPSQRSLSAPRSNTVTKPRLLLPAAKTGRQ